MSIKQNLLGFLERVELKGREVPAFNECLDLVLNLKENGNSNGLKDSEVVNEDKEEEGN